MSTPQQPDHRPGGVRSAINDLLGRNDAADRDPAADDRHSEEKRLAQGRADAGLDTPLDERPRDDRSGDGVVGAAAPAGDQTYGDRRSGDAAPGSARHGDVSPGGPGYADPAGNPQVTDPSRPNPAGQNPAGQNPAGQNPAGQNPTAGAHDLHDQGGAHAGPAGDRTVDIGGPEHDRADTGVDGRADQQAGGDLGRRADDRASGSDATATTGPIDRTAPADGIAPDTAAAGRSATDSSGSGSATAGTTPPGHGAGQVAATTQGQDSDGRERLVSTDRATSYASRWDAVKGQFVDEPRKAVADADALVGELLDELQTLFTEQRRNIEHGLASDETSTEDMRLALRRYRSFFDRLLSI